MAKGGLVKIDELIGVFSKNREGVFNYLEYSGIEVYTLVPTKFEIEAYSITRCFGENLDVEEQKLIKLGIIKANSVALSVSELRKLKNPGQGRMKVSEVVDIDNKGVITYTSKHQLHKLHAINDEKLRRSRMMHPQTIVEKMTTSHYELYIECDDSKFKGLSLDKIPVWIDKKKLLSHLSLSKYFPNTDLLEKRIKSSDVVSNGFIDCLMVAYEHYFSEKIIDRIIENEVGDYKEVINASIWQWINSMLADSKISQQSLAHVVTFVSSNKLDADIKELMISELKMHPSSIKSNKPMLLQFIKVIAENRLAGNRDFSKQEWLLDWLHNKLPGSTKNLREAIAGAVQYEGEIPQGRFRKFSFRKDRIPRKQSDSDA